jgi:hypothetical protein
VLQCDLPACRCQFQAGLEYESSKVSAFLCSDDN